LGLGVADATEEDEKQLGPARVIDLSKQQTYNDDEGTDTSSSDEEEEPDLHKEDTSEYQNVNTGEEGGANEAEEEFLIREFIQPSPPRTKHE
jgi:hypothetical protein